jgi:phage gp45-like
MLTQLMEGVVVDTNDPQQMGRIKIWVPAIDGDLYKIEDLPWATYVSPVAGQTLNYPAGPDGTKTSGLVSYGWWSVPKSGSLVVVGFLYGDANRRMYMGSYFRDHGNRSLPVGRNLADLGKTPLSDTLEPIEPQNSNLIAQFNGKLDASEAKTRGAYERAVAQGKTDKDGTEGYQTDVIDPKNPKGGAQYESQTHVLSTPGRHALIFQDNPANGRVRVKTAGGHQIILDDANERIYVSTARGNSWIELDQDGRVHVYAADGISMSTGGDFNLTAVGNVRINAGGDVDIQAGGSLKLAGCTTVNLSGKGVNLESSGGFNILASGTLLQTASAIHLNGPGAGSAECPVAPEVIPTQEPWARAATKGNRNANWKA